MPLPLLLALIVAFGLDFDGWRDPPPSISLTRGLAWIGGCLAFLAVASAIFGLLVAWRIDRIGGPTRRLRRVYTSGRFGLELLLIGLFAAAIHGLGWPRLVDRGLGLRDAILLDEVAILLPYLLGQLAIRWGLNRAERALRPARLTSGREIGIGRTLVLQSRQAWGLILPVASAYALARDLGPRLWPASIGDPWYELATLAMVGVLVPVLAPALARLTWPAKPLGPGPLRARLERLARRFGFRCTDILVWDTGGMVINAGVTGTLPWFRYVFLSDALLDCLDDREIEAVFGHEVGHIAHRHLSYFALFFLGSLGVMALAVSGIERAAPAGPAGDGTWGMILKGAAGFGCLVLYFIGLFGFLSRRFERQADVFGCRAVSCGRPGCPPHPDLNAHPTAEPDSADLCPIGIRTFVEALTKVEALNGPREGPLTGLLAWRHGRVTRRVEFLNGLEGRPEIERRFQRGVVRLRWVLVVLLSAAVAAAVWTDSLRMLAG